MCMGTISGTYLPISRKKICQLKQKYVNLKILVCCPAGFGQLQRLMNTMILYTERRRLPIYWINPMISWKPSTDPILFSCHIYQGDVPTLVLGDEVILFCNVPNVVNIIVLIDDNFFLDWFQNTVYLPIYSLSSWCSASQLSLMCSQDPKALQLMVLWVLAAPDRALQVLDSLQQVLHAVCVADPVGGANPACTTEVCGLTSDPAAAPGTRWWGSVRWIWPTGQVFGTRVLAWDRIN